MEVLPMPTAAVSPVLLFPFPKPIQVIVNDLGR